MRGAFPLLLIPALGLAACDRPQIERIDLAQVQPAAAATPLPSPDTSNAVWKVAASGHALDFGDEGQAPLMTLACSAVEGSDPKLTIIRHAPAQPGAEALFAVIGNGMISRLYVDARLQEGEWRWEGSYPAQATELQVFTGPRKLQATLPGGGTLEIAGSPLPREFVNWCRALRPAGAPLPG